MASQTRPAGPYQVRDAIPEDFDAISRLAWTAFAIPAEMDQMEIRRALFEPARTHVIVHSGEMVGNVLWSGEGRLAPRAGRD